MKNRKPATLSVSLREALSDGRLKALARAAAGFGALSPLMALANPTGGQVVGGAATIAATNPNTTKITQTSQNAVINWQSFSVGSNQYVQFLQPDSSATILNRVVGSNPSNIFGNITANGQVFLVNPNGILFGKGSVLDVSGLVASTQDISDADFMAGKYNFVKGSAAPDASVINLGTIHVSGGGYVVLAGDYVENGGSISAKTGQVLLTAGGGTTLTFDDNQLIGYAVNGATLASLAGVSNTGEITARGGAVIMTADVANALTATAVNNSGFVSARSIQGHAGLIVLSATGGETENSGTLDASANQVGMTGGNIVVRSNDYTELAPTSIIDDAGDSATGGTLHVSGHEFGIHGQLNMGKGGNVLLDPSILTLEGSGGLSSQCNGCEGGVIHSNYLAHQLNNGVNMTLVASGSIVASAGFHNLTANTPVSAPGNLALKMGTLTINSLNGTLGKVTGGVADNNLTGILETFAPLAGGKIKLSGLTINIAGGFGASASKGSVQLGKVTAGVIAVNAGTITLAGNLTATAATPTGHKAITLLASHTILPGSSGFAVAGLTANSGNVSVTAGSGMRIDNGISAPKGDIHIQTATGAITLSGSITGKTVAVVHTGTSGGGIHADGITATGAYASGATINGVNVANDGIVFLNSHGSVGGLPGFKWTATGGGIMVHGGGGIGVALPSISAAGLLSVTAQHNFSGPNTIQVQSGATLKAASVILTASGSYGGKITTNDITATGANSSLVLVARNTSTFAGSAAITTGILKGAGVVNVTASGRNAKINVGSVSAGHLAEFSADSFALTSGVPVSIKTGNIKSPNISLRADAPAGATITVGSLSAVNLSSGASVTIDNFSGKTSGGVTVNGGITVSGVTDAAPRLGPNSNPEVASLNIDASGSAGFTQKLTVNGPISVTAAKGPYMGSSFFEGGPHGGTKTTIHGSGALATMTISVNGGTASVTGAITVSGADAEVSIDAKQITLGNVSVTGSGHTITRVRHAGSNTATVLYSSQNSFGLAQLGIGQQSTTKTITAGNITVSGRGQAAATLAAQNVTVGGVTVTALPATVSFKGTHSNGVSNSHLVNASESVTNYGFASLDVTAKSAANAGSSLAKFTGDIKVQGPTATVNITGAAIHAQNITVIGSGSTVVRHATGSNSAGPVSYSAKYKSGVASLRMAASFGASGNSKASIAAGNITAQGVAGALVSLHGATINTGNIQVNVTQGSLAVTGTAPASANTIFGPPHFYNSGDTTRTLAGYPVAALSIGALQATTPLFNVNVGNIVASNTAGLTEVVITATPATVGKITTGSISVTGRGPTAVNPVVNQFHPSGALLRINAGFGSADSVTINGNVKVTGEAAHYTVNVPTGTGNGMTSGSGTDGWLRASISDFPGHVTINGGFTATGVGDVNANIQGGIVKITGPVSVTSTPALNQHSVGRSSADTGVVNFTVSNAGRAFLGIAGGSQAADSVTVGGAITMTGTQGVTLRVSGANINTKGISVTAGPTGKYKFTQSHSFGGGTNIVSSGSKVGWATVVLEGVGTANAANVTVGGPITVSGFGQARVNVAGSHVTAQDISVTAGAESATLTYGTPPLSGHHLFSNGSSLTVIDNGHETGAIGAIAIGGAGYGSTQPAQTVDINGKLSVKAAGVAQLTVLGHAIDVTGSITASASKASVDGKASDSSRDTRTLVGSVGIAEVSLSAVSSAGAVSVGSAIKVKGPDATLQVNASTIKLGNVTVTGSGHTVSVTETPRSAATVLYSSQNDGGFATLALDNATVAGVTTPAVSIKTGNMSVSGKGLGLVEMLASHVSAGSIDVTAAVATTTRAGAFAGPPSNPNCATALCDSGSILFGGINGSRLLTGTKTAGEALVVIGSNPSSVNGRLNLAKSVSVGPITVDGVGSASVEIFGSSIQAKSVTVTATKGSIAAKGSSNNRGSSGVSGTFKDSVSGKGGNAGVSFDAGSHGVVTITGNISATGPVGGVRIKGQDISVTGGITVKGSGASVTTDTVFTSVSGVKTYHLHYVGSNGNHLEGVDMEASNTLAVGGTVKVTGPGLIGILAVGKTVSLGGVSGSDTGPAHYSVLNTLKSPTAVSFSASDLALVTAGRNSTGAFVPTVVAGNVSLTAKGNIFMPADLSVAGTVTAKAGGNITGSAGGVITRITAVRGAHNHHGSNSGSVGFSSAHLPHLSLTAGSATFSAGKNIQLDNETLAITNDTTLTAGGSLSINGVTLTAGGNVGLTGKTLGISGDVIKAGKDLAITANGGGIGLQNSLSGSAVNLTAAGVVSDGGVGHTIMAAAGGLSIKAGGNVNLKGETLTTSGGNAALSGATVDLTSAHVTASKTVAITATKNVLLGKTFITVGGSLAMTANGSISNGGSPANLRAVGGTLKAKGNIALVGETLNMGTGTLTMSAAGNITLNGATALASNAHLTAGGSINLDSAALNTPKSAGLIADNILLTGVTITTAALTMTASGSVEDGGTQGTITAGAIAVEAGKDINLSSTQVNIGNGNLSSIHGDAELLSILAGEGIAPVSADPNGAFIAGGSVLLGGLKLTGSYLLLQGASVSLLGTVSVPAKALIQVLPISPTTAIDVENTPTTTAGGFDLSNQSFLSLFPGTTITLGNVDQTGAVELGNNGPFSIGSTNLIVDTTGSITGLSNVTSTGLVLSLLSIAGPPIPPVTAGEIDPTSTLTGTGDQTDKKNLGQAGGTTGTGQQAGTVSQDAGNTGVCH